MVVINSALRNLLKVFAPLACHYHWAMINYVVVIVVDLVVCYCMLLLFIGVAIIVVVMIPVYTIDHGELGYRELTRLWL